MSEEKSRFHPVVCGALAALFAASCGEVVAEPDAGEDGDDASADARADASASADAAPEGRDAGPDADTCAEFELPSGAESLHDDMCESVLGFNPEEDPSADDEIPCPAGDSDPGSHGVIVQPDAEDQRDGCPASAPITRLVGVDVEGAVVEGGTTNRVDLAEGDRVLARLACPEAADECDVRVQINGAYQDDDGDDGDDELVPIAEAFIEGDDVVDVDEEIPPELAGSDRRLRFVASYEGAQPDVLVQAPGLVTAP